MSVLAKYSSIEPRAGLEERVAWRICEPKVPRFPITRGCAGPGRGLAVARDRRGRPPGNQ